MRTKTAKLISALATAAALVFSSTAAYAEEAVSTAAEPQSLETYCPTNDDEDFPFNMDINVMPGSIQYIDLDEPIYGFESVLDEEALIFNVNFSLKDEFKDFDGYEFQVYSSDYSEEIASEYLEKDEVLTLSGLSIGEGYKLGMTLESEWLTASYGGQFVIQAEWNSSLSVDLFYQLAHTEGDAAPFIDIYTETEPGNNNIAGSDLLLHSRIMNGSTISGDVDYFMTYSPIKYKDDDPDEEDLTGIVNLKYTLDLTPGENLCIEFIDENSKTIRKYETDGKVTHIFCRFANVDMGTTYWIKITSKSNTKVEYTLTSGYEFALAWYGQFISKDTEGVYWNTDKLATLEYLKKPIFLDSTESNQTNRRNHWFTYACGVVASAMILRNLNATMNGYDFRTDYSGELQADPFTVMLANSGINGTEMNINSKDFPAKFEPNSLHGTTVAPRFGVSYDFNYDISEAQLKSALNKYKYLLLYFKSDNMPHFMVLIGFGEGESFEERALVYDPYAMSYTAGTGKNGAGGSLLDSPWYKAYKSSAKLHSVGHYI